MTSTPNPYLKLNTDGNALGNPGPAGAAGGGGGEGCCETTGAGGS